MRLVAGVSGFVVGVASASVVPFHASIVFLLFTFSLLSFLFYIREGKTVFIGFSIFFVCFIGGGVRMESARLNEGVLDSSIDSKITVLGVIDDMPSVKGVTARFPLALPHGEKILVSTDAYQSLQYGDSVEVTAKLEKPQAFETETGRMFDYKEYLAKDGIGYTMSFAHVKVREHDKGNFFIGFLFQINQWFQDSLAKVLPEPHSSLAGGITIGAKQSLGESLLDKFREVGLIHIVVLSGYNVTIIAEMIMRSLSFLPNYLSLLAGVFTMTSFALMTGAGSTVVRATIMTLLALIARTTGRTHAVTRALLLAGVVMVIHNPYILVFDPSFQLSFMATLGLIHGSPIIARFIPWVTEKLMMREIISATIATQIAVLPLIIYSFGNVSLVSLPSNIFVLPTIPFAMLATFVTALTSWIPYIGFALSLSAYVLLEYTLQIVNIFSSLPFAHIIIPAIPIVGLFMLYGIIGFLFLLSRKEEFNS